VLTPLPWVFPATAITGFALFQSFSLTVTLGQDYLPNWIGTSSGVTLGLAISIGGMLAPALADAASLHLAVTVLLPLPLAALALALRLREPRFAAPSPPAQPGGLAADTQQPLDPVLDDQIRAFSRSRLPHAEPQPIEPRGCAARRAGCRHAGSSPPRPGCRRGRWR
jgi:hypothetical protein